MIAEIFFTAFFLNLFYEILHSVLYQTCLKAPLKKYIYLMFKGALFDGLSIALIYYFISSQNIIVFIFLSIIFAYFWEIVAIKNKRWEYSPKMPLILGVGITPLFQLAATGVLAIYIARNF